MWGLLCSKYTINSDPRLINGVLKTFFIMYYVSLNIFVLFELCEFTTHIHIMCFVLHIYCVVNNTYIILCEFTTILSTLVNACYKYYYFTFWEKVSMYLKRRLIKVLCHRVL